LTSISTLQIKVTVLAAVAVVARYVRLALALAAHLVTLQSTGRQLQSSPPQTLACLTVAFQQCKSVTEETGRAGIATIAASVVDTFEALARCSIAVTHCIGVDVAVTVARLTGAARTETTLGIAVIAVAAQFTTWSGVTDWALETDDRFVAQLDTGASIRTGARIAIAVGSFKCVAVVATGASFTIVTGCVVLTDASSTLGVANVCMSITVARNAASERTSVRRFVPESRCARFAVLTDITVGTITAFDPVGRRTTGATTCRFHFNIVQVSR
jgi:hypothetical protein